MWIHHSKTFRLPSKIDWRRHAPILQVLSPLLFTLAGSSGWWRQNSDRSSELDLCYHKSLRCRGWKGLGNGVGLLYRGYRDQLPPSAVTTKMRLNSTAEPNISFNLQYWRFLFMNHFAMNLKWISLCPWWQPERKNHILNSPVSNMFQFAVGIFHSFEFVHQPVLKIQERQRAHKRHMEVLLLKNLLLWKSNKSKVLWAFGCILASIIQQANCIFLHSNTSSSVACLTLQFFRTLCYKRHNFRGKFT